MPVAKIDAFGSLPDVWKSDIRHVFFHSHLSILQLIMFHLQQRLLLLCGRLHFYTSRINGGLRDLLVSLRISPGMQVSCWPQCSAKQFKDPALFPFFQICTLGSQWAECPSWHHRGQSLQCTVRRDAVSGELCWQNCFDFGDAIVSERCLWKEV